MVKLLTALAALATLVVYASAACPTNFAAVGFSGPLSTIDHGVAGSLKINSDSSFTVSNFNYDGQGDVYNFEARHRGGVELDPTQIVTPRVNTVERITIKPGLCLSNFTHIVVWCEVAQADFGHLALPTAGAAAPAPAVVAGRKLLGL